MLAATNVKISGSEKKSEQEHINISSIKRVTRKFLQVSRCSRCKTTAKKCTKKRAKLFLLIRNKNVLHLQSLFLLSKPTDFFWLFSLPSPLAVTRFYTFCLVNYRC